LSESGRVGSVGKDLSGATLVVRVPVAQQWCNELTEKIRLAVGSEPDTAEMSRLETSCEQAVGCSGDQEVCVGRSGCRREARWVRWVQHRWWL